jgi:selenophosphate synthetase-related protein
MPGSLSSLGSKSSLGSDVTGVRFEGDMLFFLLQDGRQIGMPLAWSERLAKATTEQRNHWELNGDGVGVHWPDIDEDLSAPGVVGLPD